MTNEDLANQMWYTYKARFNTHSRLIGINKFYTIIISSLSIYILCLNILQIMPNLKVLNQSLVTYYTIILSIMILVISLIFGSSDNKYIAGKFHECALEIKELYNTVSINLTNAKKEELEKYIKEYSILLKKYDLNHSNLDYEKVTIFKDKGFKFNKVYFNLKYFFRYYMILLFLMLVPIAIGFVIIFSKI